VAQLGNGLSASCLDALDHLKTLAFPAIEERIQQSRAVVKAPVEAAPGDAKGTCQRLDPNGVRATSTPTAGEAY
jgi:predicted nucleotidyltransferase